MFFGRHIGIVEHSCAEAHASVVSLEDVVVATSLATLPELLILSQFGEGDWFVSESRVEFHDRQRGCYAEYFGVRESFSGQFESLLLDSCGEAHMAVFGIDDQTRCIDIVAMSPTLDIAESDQFVAIQRYDGLSAVDFCCYVFGRPFGDARTALQCRFVDQRADAFGILCMLFLCE